MEEVIAETKGSYTEYYRKYYQEHKEAFAVYHKKYYDKNKETINDNRREKSRLYMENRRRIERGGLPPNPRGRPWHKVKTETDTV